MTTAILILSLALGYLLGSIPFGLVLTRAAGLGDVRKIGSGHIGATNVLRTGSRKLAAATLLLDALKGTAAALIGWWLAPMLTGWSGQQSPLVLAYAVPVVAGLGAFLGHLFPVWLGFKGGKGVATFIGVLVGVLWPLAVLFCAVWLAVALLTRYSSLAALVATGATLAATYVAPAALGVPPPMAGSLRAALALMALLIVIMHRANIRRLMAGEESKIGAPK
jgi:glycerol-3-phosphate acyltransferase PlsY